MLKAKTAVDLLARFAMVKRLLFVSLESRREAGLRIAKAEKSVSSIREEKRAATAMLLMLEEAVTALELDQKRQMSPPAPADLSSRLNPL